MLPEDELGHLVAQMETCLALESANHTELKELSQRVKIAITNNDAADAIKASISKAGLVTRQDVLSLESLCPEAINPRYPVMSYTMAPSPTNLRVAMEDADRGKLMTFAALAAAVIAAGIKLIKWILNLLNSTKGTGDYSATQAAQSTTIISTAIDVKKMVNVAGEGSVYDQAEIDKLRKEVFIDQFKQSTSVGFVKYFIFGDENVVGFFSTLSSQLSKETGNLVDRISRSLSFTALSVKTMIAKAKADTSTIDFSYLNTPPESLLPFVSLADKFGFDALPEDVDAAAFPRPFKDYVPIETASYEGFLRDTTTAFFQQMNTLANLDEGLLAQLDTADMLSPDWYESKAGLAEIERRTIAMIGAVSIPSNVQKQLTDVENRFNELKKVVDQLQAEAKKDANVALSMNAYLRLVNTFHIEISFIANAISTLRRLELELGRFHRYLTLGETACIRYITSLLEGEKRQAVSKVIESKRQGHATTVRRFKNYVKD